MGGEEDTAGVNPGATEGKEESGCDGRRRGDVRGLVPR